MAIKDQLCVITDEIGQDFEHVLDVISEYGIRFVDLRKIWKKNIALFTDNELQKLKDALDTRGMKVAVITPPIGKGLLPGARFTVSEKKSFLRNPEYNLSIFKRIFEIADFFSTPYIRIFSFMRAGMSSKEAAWNKMKEVLEPYIKQAEDLRKILLVENDLGMNVGSIESTKRLFSELPSKSLKLILDPGNYFMEGESTDPEAYKFFYEKDLVGHFHIKDPNRKLPVGGATFGVVGEGKINYLRLFEQAKEYGYKGLFSLETHSLTKKERVSRKSLENIIKMLDEI